MRLVKVLLVSAVFSGLAACGSNQAPISTGVSTGANAGLNSSVINNSVFFDINSNVVNKPYEKVLTVNASYLISHPYSAIQIQGNSSEVGTPEHNQELALQRAQNVQQKLLKLGVPAKQMSVTSFGNSKPAFPALANGRQPKNQRVDIIYTSLAPFNYKADKIPTIDVTTMY